MSGRWLWMVLLTVVLLGFSDKDTLNIPVGYFAKPIDGTIRLSGTFGELRPNHFHSGIDIKPTIKGAGQAIFAAADGYVFRIKVQPGGYGNALYLKHPNGYITVYAHLDAFNPEIEEYVKDYQYRKKQFSVNIYPPANTFTFKKGEEIAKLGNSGGSSGPHLHFEIRKGSLPMNPLLFDLPFEDSAPPRMHALKIYHLNDKKETLATETHDLFRVGQDYKTKNDTIAVAAWRTGLALKVYDRMTGVSNWNGIYKLSLWVNDSLSYQFKMDAFGFNETRYINAHLDYAEQVEKKSYFNRCFLLPGNKLSIYKGQPDGIVPLFKNKATKVKLVAEDIHENRSSLEFYLKRDEVNVPSPKPFQYAFDYNNPAEIKQDDILVKFPAKAFYETCYLTYSKEPAPSNSYYAEVYHLGDYTIPVHRYFDVAIKPSTPIPDRLKNKAFIAYCDKNEEINTCGGEWAGAYLKASVRQLGEYSIQLDTIPPSLKNINLNPNMQGRTAFSFKIEDETPTSGKANGLRYTASIDGKWVLMKYDGKNDKITHHFEEDLEKGEHTFRLEVRDDRNNTNTYETAFRY
jgi:hypothetical protein